MPHDNNTVKNQERIINFIQTTDGPNGARGESYVSGIKSACFPCSTCIGATFDENIAFDVGKEIAKEAKSKSADILLAPTVNNIRSPLGKGVNPSKLFECCQAIYTYITLRRAQS